MSDKCKPIGFFDSGIGGISVLKTASAIMPNENYIYYGDNNNAPYGDKSEAQIKELSLAAGDFLFSKGVKAIVMACNTATSASVKIMREKYNIPVISMEPAVKPALSVVGKGKVLVLATPATVSQARYLGLIERLGANNKVVSLGCGGLVELIEEGRTDEKSVHSYLQGKMPCLDGQEIDAVVLGCTHYSFVENEIKDFFDNAYHKNFQIFDGRHGTARQLQRVLKQRDILCEKTFKGSISFFSSGQDIHIDTFEKLFLDFIS